jgi:hypothetical protein
LLRWVPPERKGCVVDLYHEATEDLAKTALWTEQSLRYAREHGQRTLVRLLKAVKADVEFQRTLRALPSQQATHGNELKTDTADDELKREREEKKDRARHAAWELFMEAELRELRLRQDGQLGRLLGEPLAGEPPAALRRLADEDRRQARDGLVALMSSGKVSYKRLDELCEGDMPARAAANRLRTTWLKERRDGWLGPGGRT